MFFIILVYTPSVFWTIKHISTDVALFFMPPYIYLYDTLFAAFQTQLLIFTNTKHLDSVAVTEWPESIDSSGLPDLHVDAGGVRCRWNRSSLPEICTSERGKQVSEFFWLSGPGPHQFDQLGVAASKSMLVSAPCHLKIPLSWLVFPFSPRVYLLRVLGSSNSSLMNSIKQSSSVLDSRVTSLPIEPPIDDV